jgi:hypothetical protein
VLQVVSILECRKALENWELAAIDKASSEQVAETLSTAAVYLSTGTHESFPLSVLEAMASGCVVVGHDGFGAAELMREGLSVPVPSGDVLAFASQVERVVKAWGTGQEWVRRIGPAAAKHVRACFSFEREAADVVEVWGSLLDAVVAKADGASHTERSAAGTPEPPSILMAKGAEGNGKTHAKARVITERGPARALNWPPTTGRPLLSACLITKDEEEALPDCLRSL